jgi:hypothetical protein
MKKIAYVVLCMSAAATSWAADKAAPAAAATPAAAAAGNMQMDMKPAPEMEKMSKGMLGTWKCDGQSADMGKPSMHPIKSTMKMTSELGGHWIMVNYEETKTKENPMPFSFKEMIGFDKEKKMFHRMFVDNMGGHAMFHASPAAADGKMEWNGEAQMGPMKMKMKDVVTMKSDKEVAVEVTAEGQDGKWMPVANMTCKK